MGLGTPLCPLRGEGDVYGDSRDPSLGGHPWGHGDGVRDPAVPPAWGGGRLWGHQGPPGRKTYLGTRDGVRDPTVPPAWGGGVYGDMDGVREPTVPPAWGGGCPHVPIDIRDPPVGGHPWGHGDKGTDPPSAPCMGEGTSMGCGDTVRDIRTAIGDPPRCPHYEVGGHPWGHGDGVRDPTVPPAWGGGVYGDMGWG